MSIENLIAEKVLEQGWNESTTLILLTDFISEQGSEMEEKLEAFLDGKVAEEETPLGWNDALETCRNNPGFKLWEVEISKYHPEDPGTAFDSQNVYVATDEEGSIEIQDLALDIVDNTDSEIGLSASEPNELDPQDYL